MTAYVYILRCADGTLYTGWTTDIGRRIAEHETGGPRCAAYTRRRRPVILVYSRLMPDKSSAMREEARIKRLSRAEKLEMIG